tara:strand:+ start:461 stop:613 length:153 start_codon:yes stop_codon:yes gene_type:complete
MLKLYKKIDKYNIYGFHHNYGKQPKITFVEFTMDFVGASTSRHRLVIKKL